MIAETPFDTVVACIRRHAQRPDRRRHWPTTSVSLNYAELDALMDRVAAALQRRHRAGRCIATCAAPSVMQAALFLGALRAGVVGGAARAGQHAGRAGAYAREDAQAGACSPTRISPVSTRGSRRPARGRRQWRSDQIAVQHHLFLGHHRRAQGIVQPHGMRWAHVKRGLPYGYGPQAEVTLLATPLYSNTTLVVFFPSLAFGGAVVLMKKFDARRYRRSRKPRRATHTMLVPVQYQRLMAVPTSRPSTSPPSA